MFPIYENLWAHNSLGVVARVERSALLVALLLGKLPFLFSLPPLHLADHYPLHIYALHFLLA